MREWLPGIARYVSVLAIAVMTVVVTLEFSFEQAADHVARLRLEYPTATRRPQAIPPAPVVTAAELDISRVVPVIAGVGGAPERAVISRPENLAPAAEMAKAGTAVNVRAGPSKRSDRLFTLAAGETVEVAEANRGWVRVVRQDGSSGWVYSSYLVPRRE